MLRNAGLSAFILFTAMLLTAFAPESDGQTQECFVTYDITYFPELAFIAQCSETDECPEDLPCEMYTVEAGLLFTIVECICGGEEGGLVPLWCVTQAKITSTAWLATICFGEDYCAVNETCKKVPGTAAALEGKKLCDCQ